MVEQVEDGDLGDSGVVFSMDGFGVDDKELRNQWFFLRFSVVGEDDEDIGQVVYISSVFV